MVSNPMNGCNQFETLGQQVDASGVKSILKYRTDTIMTLNIPLELDVHDGLLPT